MTLALGAVADDYTGASDLANTLAKTGLRTVQSIGAPADNLPLPEVDAVVVSLKIRSAPAAEAVRRAAAAERWLRGRGARHVMYKICSTFDSTDKGNIGPVLDALKGDRLDAAVVVTPAFPETARTVYQGNLFVGPLPLNESPLKDHPLNPMRDANLVRVLQRQSWTKIGLVDLATVAKGSDTIRAQLTRLAREGTGAAIADAVFETDLEAVGAAALDQAFSIGASGLGLGLARGLIKSGRVARSDAAAAATVALGGPAACLAGSCSQATLEQVARAERAMPVLTLDGAKLVDNGAAEVAAALRWAASRLDKGPLLIASSAPPQAVATLQARYGGDRAGHAIEQAFAEIAAALVAQGVRRLVVAGGETSGAVVDRLAIPAFELGPEIAAGVPVLNAIGGRYGAMRLALKSGNFGRPDFFTDALALMP